MFTPEVSGRASICIRPWARFFLPLIGLSMRAQCLLSLITSFFFPETVLQRVQIQYLRPAGEREEGSRGGGKESGKFTSDIFIMFLTPDSSPSQFRFTFSFTFLVTSSSFPSSLPLSSYLMVCSCKYTCNKQKRTQLHLSPTVHTWVPEFH